MFTAHIEKRGLKTAMARKRSETVFAVTSTRVFIFNVRTDFGGFAESSRLAVVGDWMGICMGFVWLMQWNEQGVGKCNMSWCMVELQ